jgi:hypothetical protein
VQSVEETASKFYAAAELHFRLQNGRKETPSSSSQAVMAAAAVAPGGALNRRNIE